MINFTQDELKTLVMVLDAVSFKLTDVPRVMPIREKLMAEILPEKPAAEKTETEEEKK